MNKERIERKISDDLDLIKKQLREIKEHMVDIDCLLTAEEKELILSSVQKEERGEQVPLIKFEESASITFNVLLEIPAQSFLIQSDETVRSRTRETLNELANDPVPRNAKRIIESAEKLFRLRSRYLRLLYKVDYEKRTLVVIAIEPLTRMDI